MLEFLKRVMTAGRQKNERKNSKQYDFQFSLSQLKSIVTFVIFYLYVTEEEIESLKCNTRFMASYPSI